jgi:CRP-like cAMP-binding protein
MSMSNPLKEFVVPYYKDQTIFEEGETGSEMYIIQSGAVEIFRSNHGEKRFSLVLEKGDFFGEMSLLEGVPRTMTARAMEDSELIVINGSTFDQMIKSNIEIAVRMMRKLSLRLRETTEQLEQALAKGGGQRPGATPTILPEAEASKENVTRAGTPEDLPPVLAQFIGEGSLHVFPVFKEISLIGRRDPVTGITPDVDLTDEDVKRSVSRRHAKLIYSNGQFFLAEEVGTLNGTFINNKRLATGILTALKSGSVVGFGMLRLKFVEPTRSEDR